MHLQSCTGNRSAFRSSYLYSRELISSRLHSARPKQHWKIVSNYDIALSSLYKFLPDPEHDFYPNCQRWPRIWMAAVHKNWHLPRLKNGKSCWNKKIYLRKMLIWTNLFESDFLKSRANHWRCSCLKKSERFAHSRSFVKSDKSDSLVVALFKRAPRAKEQRSKDRKSKFLTLPDEFNSWKNLMEPPFNM